MHLGFHSGSGHDLEEAELKSLRVKVLQKHSTQERRSAVKLILYRKLPSSLYFGPRWIEKTLSTFQTLSQLRQRSSKHRTGLKWCGQKLCALLMEAPPSAVASVASPPSTTSA